LQSIPEVKEVAAVAVSREGGPCQLVIYANCAQNQIPDKEALMVAMQNAIKRDLNPLFKIHDLVLVGALPRTASNKIMRRALRDQYLDTENAEPRPSAISANQALATGSRFASRRT
jgi:acetyl-CoA synthetase